MSRYFDEVNMEGFTLNGHIEDIILLLVVDSKRHISRGRYARRDGVVIWVCEETIVFPIMRRNLPDWMGDLALTNESRSINL